MPGESSLSSRMASRETPRRPQWISMKRRHRRLGDAAAEAVAHDEIKAAPELFDEGIELAEIVGIVAVAHDDVAASRRLDAAEQRGPVAAALHRRDTRPARPGDCL